ncbi:MAG: hypothetical protein U9N81_04205 [Bacillota bacterium]|nr:hypothetical protein [Bacillota bacterium]
MVDKANMTEEEIKLNYITSAITSKWDKTKIRMEYYFTDGRIQIEGKKASRKKGKKADYLLYFKSNLPIAIVEAKDNKHTILGGMSMP